MRRFGTFVGGFGLGFAIAAFTIASLIFFGLGVGGHFLVTNDEGVAQIISYDPSSVAAKAPFPAGAALVLLVLFVIVYLRLRRRDARTSVKARPMTDAPQR